MRLALAFFIVTPAAGPIDAATPDEWVTVTEFLLPEQTTHWADAQLLTPPVTVIRTQSGEVLAVVSRLSQGPRESPDAAARWRVAFRLRDGRVVPAERLGGSLGLDEDRWIDMQTVGPPAGVESPSIEAIAMQAPATPDNLAKVDARRRETAEREERIDAMQAQLPFPQAVIGEPFGFELTALDGTLIRSADHLGRPLVLEIWASWCAPCARESLRLREILQRIGPQDIAVIGISLDEDVEAARAFAARHQPDWPHYVAGDADLGAAILKRFGLEGIPAYLVLDASGVLRHVNPGDALEQVLGRMTDPSLPDHSKP